jgi:two-component system sensor histidine kinase AgrC
MIYNRENEYIRRIQMKSLILMVRGYLIVSNLDKYILRRKAMILMVCDILNTFCQAYLFVWVCNNIANKENKLPNNKFYGLMALIFAEIVILTYSKISNLPLANFIIVIVVLFLCLLFYRNFILDAFLGVGLGYSIILIQGYCLVTLYQNVFIHLNLKLAEGIQMLIFIYIPIWCSYYFIFRFRKNIFNAAMLLKGLKHSLVFVLILDYALIFVDTLRMEWTASEMGLIFKAILYMLALVVFIFSVVYFAKINDKSKEVEMLNAALNEKITELKKVKHDYGSEISGLYGLYQLGRMDRIGELLKNIVEKNQSLTTSINVNIQATPIVYSALQLATSKGIDVIVFDSGNYEDLNIDVNDLLRLLSNIIKNSIDILEYEENPIIKFKSYNSYNGITITIENNGPEIPKEIRNKIFNSGFSTKEDADGDHGFGLSIVKDIIDKCSGEIKVESNKSWTQFSIEIPYKTA